MKSNQEPSRADQVRNTVAQWMKRYQLLPEPRQRQLRAQLRHSLGKNLTQSPEVWGMILENAPDSLIGKSEKPTSAENAIFYTLTLFAMGKQSDQNDVSVGKAAAQLLLEQAQKEGKAYREDKNPVYSRLQRILSSATLDDLVVPLRALLQLLGQKGIPLSYPDLARDLYRFSYPEGQEYVISRWAKDYFYTLSSHSKQDDTAE